MQYRGEPAIHDELSGVFPQDRKLKCPSHTLKNERLNVALQQANCKIDRRLSTIEVDIHRLSNRRGHWRSAASMIEPKPSMVAPSCQYPMYASVKYWPWWNLWPAASALSNPFLVWQIRCGFAKIEIWFCQIRGIGDRGFDKICQIRV